MPYDPRRLVGQHPGACTCHKCNEAKRAAGNRETAERLLREAEGKGRRAPVRNLSPKSPGKTTQSGPVMTPGQLAERLNNPPTSSTLNPAPPRVKYSSRSQHAPGCACMNCRSTRVSRAAQPAHAAQPKKKPGRTAGLGVSPRSRAAKGITIGGIIGTVAAGVFLILFVINIAGSSGRTEDGTQADQGGGWFSLDCDAERARKRGGWLRELIC